jgi:glycine/D-amino acid oxidase-like deaminating enzyme
VSARTCDIAIVGGGLAGAAIAFGLRHLGPKVLVLDEGDVAHRASRGNFGLIWVQGKGLGLPAYAQWTGGSARAWPRLAADLAQETGIDVALRQPGGIHVCLSQQELDARVERIQRFLAQPGIDPAAIDVLDRAALLRRLPRIGPDVVGGTWCAQDGDCNPLRLFRALHVALERAGCGYRPRHAVTAIERRAGTFELHTARGVIEAGKVVLAAGLANATLAPMVGLAAPVTPNKGQIIVLERVETFLPLPLETLRQTDDGTVLIGDSQQDKGFDETLDLPILATMSERALRVFPFLRDVRVVRTWAALRVMSPDGFPIYQRSTGCPGAYLATCHSGVTLAAAHAFTLAPALLADGWPDALAPYDARRFDVRAAA